MTRLLELALLLTPLAAYLLWRTMIRRGIANPSRNTLILLASAVVLLGGSLALLSRNERHSGASRYVPARLDHGRIIPGHDA